MVSNNRRKVFFTFFGFLTAPFYGAVRAQTLPEIPDAENSLGSLSIINPDLSSLSPAAKDRLSYIMLKSKIQAAGPSNDPDYYEFWVQTVPSDEMISTPRNTEIDAAQDWSEEAVGDISPGWAEMMTPDGPLKLRLREGGKPVEKEFYRSVMEAIRAVENQE